MHFHKCFWFAYVSSLEGKGCACAHAHAHAHTHTHAHVCACTCAQMVILIWWFGIVEVSFAITQSAKLNACQSVFSIKSLNLNIC